MPDVPYPKPEPPTRREATAARVSTALDALVAFVRQTLTGDKHGVVRRPLLYLIAAGGIAIAMSQNSTIVLIPSLISVMLLALTDAVVEL